MPKVAHNAVFSPFSEKPVSNQRSYYEFEREKEAMRIYQMVKDSGLIPLGYTFLIEFGFDKKSGKLIIYQIKLFRKIEEQRMIMLKESLYYSMNGVMSFGITPDKGEEMFVTFLHKNTIKTFQEENKVCYVDSKPSHESDPLDVQPRNLYAYGAFDYSILFHGDFRWAMKADVFFNFPGENLGTFSPPKRAKVYSDGFMHGGLVLLNK